jgi:NADPH-dependent ferric siderophore reductase
MQNRPDLAVGRVRHQLKFRLAQVKRVQPLTPHLVRVTLGGDDLNDFESASFDDHIKVFFPPPGADKPVMPAAGPNGPVFPDDQPRPIARDFTPRRYDREACESISSLRCMRRAPPRHGRRKRRSGNIWESADRVARL